MWWWRWRNRTSPYFPSSTSWCPRDHESEKGKKGARIIGHIVPMWDYRCRQWAFSLLLHKPRAPLRARAAIGRSAQCAYTRAVYWRNLCVTANPTPRSRLTRLKKEIWAEAFWETCVPLFPWAATAQHFKPAFPSGHHSYCRLFWGGFWLCSAIRMYSKV